jgi:hypothetical protein
MGEVERGGQYRPGVVHCPPQSGPGVARELLYRPAGHAMHVLAPVRLYVPFGQASWELLSEARGQMYPAAQGPLQAGEERLNVAP